MLAFHNDPSLKSFVLSELQAHAAADTLIKGRYWEGGKGCAVGCTLEAVRRRNGERSRIQHSKHALYEPHLGIPEVLAVLEDGIFENLDNGASQIWPIRFTSAIAPGADLSMVWPRFALWLLRDFLPPIIKSDAVKAAIPVVADLYREWVGGEKPSEERWKGAYAAAASAAAGGAAAAYAAAASAAAAFAAAYAYAYAAANAAANAANANAANADAAERDQAYSTMADKLIEIITGCAPVSSGR